ncbi:hypothetical protein FRB95_003131 [Tulasnella sp. JGI-2019a]|nr:hypothetical protein FRB95_003131 [Tulasnella sp. JGI-2019a]
MVAPALEVLIIRGASSFAEVDTSSWKIYRLRRFKLRRLYIPSKSRMLSGLQTLDLGYLRGYSPSVVKLLAILTASPGLVEPRLKSLTYMDEYMTPAQIASVELPVLEALSIIQVSHELTPDLLATICTPRCTSFEISYRQEYDSDFGLFNDSALAYITSLLVTYIRASPMVTITWDDSGSIKLTLWAISRSGWRDAAPAGLSSALEGAESDI